MGRETFDLSPQIDGVQTYFTTPHQRQIGTSTVFYEGDKVLEANYEEPDNTRIRTLFVPQVGEELTVTYETDETFDGRSRGFPVDPSTLPAPAVPPTLDEKLDDIENRLDSLENEVGKPPDPTESVQAASVSDVGGTYDSTGGLALAGQMTDAPLVVDGVTLQSGYRVLLKDQANKDENWIWEVLTAGTGADGVWERAKDADSGLKVTNGAVVFVTGGTQAKKSYMVTTPDPIVVGGASGTEITVELVGEGTSPSFVNIGAATESTDLGDLAAGDSPTKGLFYDASEGRLTIGECAAMEADAFDQALPLACFYGRDASGSGKGAGLKLFPGQGGPAGGEPGDIFIFGWGPQAGSYRASTIDICSGTSKILSGQYAALRASGCNVTGGKGGQTEIEGGFCGLGTPAQIANANGGDLLLRSGSANGSLTATSGHTVIEVGKAINAITKVPGDILIGTGYTSVLTNRFVDTRWWHETPGGLESNKADPPSNIKIGAAQVRVHVGNSATSLIGWFGTDPVGRPTIAGSRASGAALTDLLSKLALSGFLVDGTTA